MVLCYDKYSFLVLLYILRTVLTLELQEMCGENLANLKPKLEKNFHHDSEKCSGSSYLDFALILLLRFLYVRTDILAGHTEILSL